MGYHVESTWTYGKPRLGNVEFANSFVAAATKQGVSSPIWRIVHFLGGAIGKCIYMQCTLGFTLRWLIILYCWFYSFPYSFFSTTVSKPIFSISN